MVKHYAAAYVESSQARELCQLVGRNVGEAHKLHCTLYFRGVDNWPKSLKLHEASTLLYATIRDVVELETNGSRYLIAVLGDCDWAEDFHDYYREACGAEKGVYWPHVTLSTSCAEGASESSRIKALRGIRLCFNRHRLSGKSSYTIVPMSKGVASTATGANAAFPYDIGWLKVSLDERLAKSIAALSQISLSTPGAAEYISSIELQTSPLSLNQPTASKVSLYTEEGQLVPELSSGQLLYISEPFWIKVFLEDNGSLKGRFEVSLLDTRSQGDDRFLRYSEMVDLGWCLGPQQH